MNEGRAALAALALALVSAAPAPPAPAWREITRDAAVSDLLGLSPDEVSRRLLPLGEAWRGRLSAAGLIDADLVTVESLEDLGVAPLGVISKVEGAPRRVSFVFTNGRLTAVDGQQFAVERDPRTPPSALPPGSRLSLAYRRESPAARDLAHRRLAGTDTLATGLFAPVVVPLKLAHGAKVSERAGVRARAAAAVAELELGAQAPGGLDGYLARWRGTVHPISRDGADAELRLDFGQVRPVASQDDDAWALHVFVADGRVAAIGSGFLLTSPCRLPGPTRRLDCRASAAAE